MAIVRTAVVLLGVPAGQSISLEVTDWYRRYFFDAAYGQSAFWRKQWDNEVILDGQVFGWTMVNDPNPNLMNRTSVAQFAVSTLQSDHDVDFEEFEVIVVVLALPPSYPADGGSTLVRSSSRLHRAVVMRARDRLDFVAHELGHRWD